MSSENPRGASPDSPGELNDDERDAATSADDGFSRDGFSRDGFGDDGPSRDGVDGDVEASAFSAAPSLTADHDSRGGPLTPYQQLLRLFLTPTAIADSYAGLMAAACISGGAVVVTPSHVATMFCASIALYWLGMVLNDIVDRKKDAVTAPQKPIPSGRVPLASALTLSAMLLAAALTAGVARGILPSVGLVLVFILAYDLGGKRVPVLGNLLMGGCRGANFLLGSAIYLGSPAALQTTELLLGAALLTLYIAAVTAVSKLEDRPFAWHSLALRSAPCWALVLFFVARSDSGLLPLVNAALLATLLADGLFGAHRRLRPQRSLGEGPEPTHDAGEASRRADDASSPADDVSSREAAGVSRAAASYFVHRGLAAIYFVDAGVLLLLSPPEHRKLFGATLTLYCFFALGWVWKRRWARAGMLG